MNTFGASAPLKEPQTNFGFRPDRFVESTTLQITRQRTWPREEI
jgi:hypothetical protein